VFLSMLLFALPLACDDDDDDDDDDDNDTTTDDDDDNDNDDNDDDDNDDDNNDTAADDDDDDDDDTVLPEGCIAGDFSVYFGMLHSHSAFSDGRGTPRTAYEHARDEGDLDVFALTDHLELLYLPIPPDKWERLHDIADEFYEPGSYVSLVGFEYSSAFDLPTFVSSGHINVFFSDEMFPIIMLDYHYFYELLLQCPDCLAQFNHPGYGGQTNWDNFEYDPDMDSQINQIELSTWHLDAWPFLFEALDKGWRLSPTWNQDNHDGGWGTEDDHRTGLWLSDLTRESVRDCLRDRRTFSTLDKNASLRFQTAEGCWMGSDLSGTTLATLLVEAVDPDEGDGFASLELWGNGEQLLLDFDCAGNQICELEDTLTLSGAGDYVLVRAVQEDGDLLVSAPIWFGP